MVIGFDGSELDGRAVIQKELHPDRNAHQTVLARRREERRQIALFQNTPARFHGRPELSERLTEELRRVARDV